MTSPSHFVNTVTRPRVLIGCIAVLSAFAAQAAGPQTMKLPMKYPQNYFSEKCFTLEAGQRLAYQVSTRHPIEFNLHHHRADGTTIHPERLLVKSQHAKQFVAESTGGYCFMATNLADQPGTFEVVINYEITAR